MNEQAKRFWQEFCSSTGRAVDTPCFDCFHFELDEQSATHLLSLVLSGQKRATASALPSFEKEGTRLPRVGDLSIVTAFDGTPRCVIETTAITIRPFRDMTFDIVCREGEDDTLESWQRNHIAFFEADGSALGYAFDWDMPVVFEDFQVVYAP